jgi:antitoxin MazE
VEVVVKRGQIVIQPSRKLDYDLKELLAGITLQNLHGEFDFGAPAGKEML